MRDRKKVDMKGMGDGEEYGEGDRKGNCNQDASYENNLLSIK